VLAEHFPKSASDRYVFGVMLIELCVGRAK
jgi:hypothetical protein